MLTGKNVRWTGEEKQLIKEKRLEIRNKYEMQNLGDFELIYPPQNKESLLSYYRTL